MGTCRPVAAAVVLVEHRRPRQPEVTPSDEGAAGGTHDVLRDDRYADAHVEQPQQRLPGRLAACVGELESAAQAWCPVAAVGRRLVDLLRRAPGGQCGVDEHHQVEQCQVARAREQRVRGRGHADAAHDSGGNGSRGPRDPDPRTPGVGVRPWLVDEDRCPGRHLQRPPAVHTCRRDVGERSGRWEHDLPGREVVQSGSAMQPVRHTDPPRAGPGPHEHAAVTVRTFRHEERLAHRLPTRRSLPPLWIAAVPAPACGRLAEGPRSGRIQRSRTTLWADMCPQRGARPRL